MIISDDTDDNSEVDDMTLDQMKEAQRRLEQVRILMPPMSQKKMRNEGTHKGRSKRKINDNHNDK